MVLKCKGGVSILTKEEKQNNNLGKVIPTFLGCMGLKCKVGVSILTKEVECSGSWDSMKKVINQIIDNMKEKSNKLFFLKFLALKSLFRKVLIS